MIVRAVDENNDWLFGKGLSDYKYDVQALAQVIQTRLQSHLGDCFFALTEGIDWFNLLGSKRVLDFKLALSTTILNTEGVTGLVELNIITTPNRRFTISYSVNTVYGIANGTIDPQEISNA